MDTQATGFWDERWVGVRGFEGLYWVSDQGRVKGPRKYLALTKNNKGYPTVRLYKFRALEAAHFLVHRLVWEAFNGPLPNDEWRIHHKDHNKTNNALENLDAMHYSQHSRYI